MVGIKFHPDVALEVTSSHDLYQSKADGLGDDFLNELESAFQTIESLPETWPKFHRGFRRFVLAKFPFSVIYRQADNGVIYVVAVMHHSRKPGYWVSRI